MERAPYRLLCDFRHPLCPRGPDTAPWRSQRTPSISRPDSFGYQAGFQTFKPTAGHRSFTRGKALDKPVHSLTSCPCTSSFSGPQSSVKSPSQHRPTHLSPSYPANPQQQPISLPQPSTSHAPPTLTPLHLSRQSTPQRTTLQTTPRSSPRPLLHPPSNPAKRRTEDRKQIQKEMVRPNLKHVYTSLLIIPP